MIEKKISTFSREDPVGVKWMWMYGFEVGEAMSTSDARRSTWWGCRWQAAVVAVSLHVIDDQRDGLGIRAFGVNHRITGGHDIAGLHVLHGCAEIGHEFHVTGAGGARRWVIKRRSYRGIHAPRIGGHYSLVTFCLHKLGELRCCAAGFCQASAEQPAGDL